MNNQYDCQTPHIIRTFDIEAISLPIVYNKYGDHDPNGLLYVLSKDSERIQQKARENFMLNPPQPYEEVRPLVIRANVGDKINIRFHNKLNRLTSIHVQGLGYDIDTSDGANVGFNKDTTTDGEILYTWFAVREGVYLFNDMADTRSSEEGTNVHACSELLLLRKREPNGATLSQENRCPVDYSRISTRRAARRLGNTQSYSMMKWKLKTRTENRR